MIHFPVILSRLIRMRIVKPNMPLWNKIRFVLTGRSGRYLTTMVHAQKPSMAEDADMFHTVLRLWCRVRGHEFRTRYYYATQRGTYVPYTYCEKCGHGYPRNLVAWFTRYETKPLGAE